MASKLTFNWEITSLLILKELFNLEKTQIQISIWKIAAKVKVTSRINP